jgi:PleD family two-component response regulator
MSSLSTGPLVSRTATRPGSVLVIDHCQIDRRQICRQLRMIYGPLLKIREVDAAGQALELLEQGAFDLVLIEYQLPGLDGLELLGQVLEVVEGAAIILMTSQANDRLAAEALRQGASDYLVKGDVGPAEFEQMINFALRTARLEDRNAQFVQRLHAAHQQTNRFLTNLSQDLDTRLMLLERSLRGLRQQSACSTAPWLLTDLASLHSSLMRTRQSLDDLMVLSQASDER